MTNMQLQFSNLLEQKQHNRAMEQLGAEELQETVRAHQASESLKQAEIQQNAEIARMQDATNKLLASLRNTISEKQLDQAERQMAKQFERTDAEILQIQSNTKLTDAKKDQTVQDTAGDLKTKLGALLGKQIDFSSAKMETWLDDKNNRVLLKKALTQPAYKSIIDGWQLRKQVKQQKTEHAQKHSSNASAGYYR